MQIDITLKLEKCEMDLIEKAVFMSLMQLYDIQLNSEDAKDKDCFLEMDNLYKKLTGVDYKTILQRVDLSKEMEMKY